MSEQTTPAAVPTPGPTGQIHDIGYRHYDGPRLGAGFISRSLYVDTLRGAGADDVAIWVLADDEDTRAFLVASGLGPDGAFRELEVPGAQAGLREVRLVAGLDGGPG